MAEALPNPVVEDILDDIETTLEGVTEANGYHADLVVRTPWPVEAMPEEDGLTCTVITGLAPETVGEEEEQNASEFQFKFTVQSIVIVPTDGNDDPQRLLLRRWADIYKALCDGYGPRSGNAISTYLDEAIFFLDATASKGEVDIPFVCRFQTQPNNPFAK